MAGLYVRRLYFFCFFSKLNRHSSAKKSLGLIPTVFIILLFLFHIDSAKAAVTAQFADKCSCTSSDRRTFSAPSCEISLGRPTVYPCVLSKYEAAIGIIFPGGALFEMVVSCSEHSNPYKVNGTTTFN